MIRKMAIKICQKNDLLYRHLKPLNRRYVYLKAKILSALRSLGRNYTLDLDIDKLIMVKPSDVIYCCKTSSNKFFDKGKVLSGDWDKGIVPFEEYLGLYNAFKDTLIHGKPFEETDYYKLLFNSIKKGNIIAGCRSIEDLGIRVKQLRKLFEDIKHNGFKLQSEIPNNNDFVSQDDVAVHIDHSGHFLFADGAHRMAIAKLLNIKEIPVRVSIRHSKWVGFRREILDIARYQGGKIYQKITHPDLRDIPASHGDERIKIIRKNLTLKQGNVLDIGAHWGYYCHHFEEMGFDCSAVEQDSVHIYFLEKLRDAENRRFKIIKDSALSDNFLSNDGAREYDIVLALNIFHHFIKTKNLYSKLIEFLSRVKTKCMFFEPHLKGELDGESCYRNYNEGEFVGFVMKYSHLTNQKSLGRAKDGRVIYKLWRDI